ncbi:MAG: hypothetical protein RJA22_601 [Verrucomicrobiota bacterium]|jgi:hypothetical protein
MSQAPPPLPSGPPGPPRRPWHKDWRFWLSLGLLSILWLVELPFRILGRLLSLFW